MSLNIKDHIRDVQDFPKKGIVFKDITTLLGNKQAFQEVINNFVERYRDKPIDKIVAADARGFIIGSVLAYELGAGFVPVRKKGKLPYRTIEASYELEYGSDTLHMHEDAIRENESVLIVDDLLATGGTAEAMCELVKQQKGKIIEIAFLIELSFLNGRDKLKGYQMYSQIVY